MALTPQGEALLTQLNADLEAWDMPIETRLAQLAVLPASDREQIPTILSRGVDALRAQADAATDRIEAALSAGQVVTGESRQAAAEYNDRLRQLAGQLEQLANRVTHLGTPVAAVTEQSPTPAQQLRPVSIRRAVPSQVPAPQVSCLADVGDNYPRVPRAR